MKKRRQYLKQAQVLKQVRDYTIQSAGDSDEEGEAGEDKPKKPKTLAEKLLAENSKQERYSKLSVIATKKKKEFKDPNFFMEYTKDDPAPDASEDHYALNGASKKKKQLTSVVSSEFNEIPQSINDAVMDIGGETREELNNQRKKQGMI